ncbi:hypothetical protein FPQ18DRAFT_314593 [Pyronema domesticum]|nr:hypothetical protein FPQ18DRAFT_314593 [Pyronema domesticum]
MEKRFKKVFTSVKSRVENVGSSHRHSGSKSNDQHTASYSINGITPKDGSSEGTLLSEIQAFCETGGPGNPNSGEEFLHLPAIVDLAESAPTMCTLAATAIRRNLDLKNISRPYVQYNSIMLIRILSQNPGHIFTRNLGEQKWVTTVKELLRQGRDPSVHQILCETLENFTVEPERIADESLNGLRELWAKEKGNGGYGGQQRQQQMPIQPLVMPPSMTMPLHQEPEPLPSPQELAARISEANTSAKLLQQLVQSTPVSQINGHELIQEFKDRCKLAQRSVQGYIQADPPTDVETLTTLIETNDHLSMSLQSLREAVQKARDVTAQNQVDPFADPADAPGTGTGLGVTGAPGVSWGAPGAPGPSGAAAARPANGPQMSATFIPGEAPGAESHVAAWVAAQQSHTAQQDGKLADVDNHNHSAPYMPTETAGPVAMHAALAPGEQGPRTPQGGRPESPVSPIAPHQKNEDQRYRF